MFDFQNGGRLVRFFHFIFSQLLSKIQISAYFYLGMQNFVEIGRAVAELMPVDFQKWRPSVIFDF